MVVAARTAAARRGRCCAETDLTMVFPRPLLASGGSAFATAINNNGLITINVGTGRGYVFCPDGTECPGGQTAEVKIRKIQVGRFPVYRPR